MSAFLSYSKEMRPKIRQEFPGMKNADVSVVLAQRWRAAPEAEKKPHLDQEKQDRQKYYRDLAVFKAAEEERLREEEADRRRQSTRETIDFLNLPGQLNWGSGSSTHSQSHSGGLYSGGSQRASGSISSSESAAGSGSSSGSQVGSDDGVQAAAEGQGDSAKSRKRKHRRKNKSPAPTGETSSQRPQLHAWSQLAEPQAGSQSSPRGLDGQAPDAKWARWSPSQAVPGAAAPHAGTQPSTTPGARDGKHSGGSSGGHTSGSSRASAGGARAAPGAERSSRVHVRGYAPSPSMASSLPTQSAAPGRAASVPPNAAASRPHVQKNGDGTRGPSAATTTTARGCHSPCSDSSRLGDEVHEGLSAYVSYMDDNAPQYGQYQSRAQSEGQQLLQVLGLNSSAPRQPSKPRHKHRHSHTDKHMASVTTRAVASTGHGPMNVVTPDVPVPVPMSMPVSMAGGYPCYIAHPNNGIPTAPVPYPGYCTHPPDLMLHPPGNPPQGPQPPGADLWDTMLAQQQHQQWYMPAAYYFMVGDEWVGGGGAGGRGAMPASTATSQVSGVGRSGDSGSVCAVNAGSVGSGIGIAQSASMDSGIVSPLTNPSTFTDANQSPRGVPVVAGSGNSVNGASMSGHTTASASSNGSGAHVTHRPEYQALRTLHAVSSAGLYDWAVPPPLASKQNPPKQTHTTTEQILSQLHVSTAPAALPASVSSSSPSNSSGSDSGTRKSSDSYPSRVPSVKFASLPPGWH
jgi:hypothetical protein